ncbi:MAG: hypothetical protein GYB65_08105, partial [Chloroflexi bacterium]|nr:hypothetical protein [Chloroflexota bacterium]
GKPMISLLERGAFDADASALVYGALQFFALGLIFQSVHEVIARSFYADKDTITPLWTAVIAAGVNLLLVVGIYVAYTQQLHAPLEDTFVAWGERFADAEFRPAQNALADGSGTVRDQTASFVGVGGLAFGYSITFLIELALLLVILKRRWGDIDARNLTLTTLRTIAASAIMGVAVVGVDAVLGAMGWHEDSLVLTTLRILALAGTGAVTFLVAAILLGVQEIRALPGMVLRRKPAADQAPAETTA